jgi:limonene-1,2-epoxide hydrolase
VRFRLLLLLCAVLVAGCGSGGGGKAAAPRPPTPEEIVRAWSTALNSNQDKKAAALFADGAKITQGDVEYTLINAANRFDFNSGLPCSGQIVELHATGAEVTATFQLGERADHRCDAPGVNTTAIFTIRNGKIVAFRQLAAPEQSPVA